MFRKKITALITLTSLLFATSNVQAQDDMKGSADHPEVPRIAGTVIRGYAAARFVPESHQFHHGWADLRFLRV